MNDIWMKDVFPESINAEITSFEKQWADLLIEEAKNIQPMAVLKTLPSMTFDRAYNPYDLPEAFDLRDRLQDITIYPPPLFIMSPRMKIYDAKSIVKAKGYLDLFVPNNPFETTESPEATMQIMIQSKEN
jgi:hypothetical protein